MTPKDTTDTSTTPKDLGFTHLDEAGRPRMVDVSAKPDTVREATAIGWIEMKPETLATVEQGQIGKGDVLAAAQVAAIMAAKRTWELIPMCHPLFITNVSVDFQFDELNNRIAITATAKTTGKTGVEMEALTAVSVAGLTIYDMCKAIDRAMVIGNIRLKKKSGGKSGTIDFDTEEKR